MDRVDTMIRTRSRTLTRAIPVFAVTFFLVFLGRPVWSSENNGISDRPQVSDAEQLLKARNYKKAAELCFTLLDKDTDGSVHAALVVALAKQGKQLDAEQLLRKAKDRFPDQPKVMAAAALTSYLHSWYASGPAKRDLYLQAAENLSRRSTLLSPENLLAHQVLALSRQALYQRTEAISGFRKCLEIEESPENLINLAQALSEENSLNTEVQDLICRALALDSSYYPARVQQAIVWLSKNQTEEALKELMMVPKTARDAQWSVTEGRILIKQGYENMAIGSWNLARKLDRYLLEPYRQLALYYCSKNEHDLVINELNKARDLFPYADDEIGKSLRIYYDEELLFRRNIHIDDTEPTDKPLPPDVSLK